MNEESIKELFSNEEYVKSLFELGSYDKAAEKLEEDGVKVSAEELKKVLELVKKKTTGELNDEDLEQASGGIATGAIFVISMVAGIGASVAVKCAC